VRSGHENVSETGLRFAQAKTYQGSQKSSRQELAKLFARHAFRGICRKDMVRAR
jgi:hypothetical protein